MKLRNFLTALALMGVGAGGLVAGAMIFREAPPPEPAPLPAIAEAPSSPAAVASGDVLAMTDAAREVLSHRTDALPVDKVKDISPSRSYKINLYQDPGHKTVNRAKLDLDRDEKWDEKYTFAQDGSVSREISPGENDEYPDRFLLDGERWVRDGARVAAPAAEAVPSPASTPDATPASASPAGRPVDQDVLAFKGKNIGSDKLKDAVKGKAYKINVYQDAGETTANRAKIDLDRDDKWDEKITFKGDEITRDVAPADDEAYTEHYRWNGSGWVASP